MSVSKSIRKKRRQSKKRNMRGGSAPISELAVGAFNTSFVASAKVFYEGPASENSSIALRSKKLYYLLNDKIPDPSTLQDFISNNYIKFFQMSCRIVAKFMEQYKSTQYCALALQELNLTDEYLGYMNNEIGQVSSVILANGVQAGIVNAGLGYVIPNEKLGNYRDTHTITGVFEEERLRPWFSSTKVAIVDLGIDKIYTDYKILKNANGMVDSARPMALIVREEGTNEKGTIYTLHFNCHIPNPSALKRGDPYILSILEKYLGNPTEQKHIDDFEIWAAATLEVINKNAKILLKAFFTEDEIKSFLTSNNYTVIFSGDFNDGSRFLLDLITDEGISITMVDGTTLTLQARFGLMPETCCANRNSVRTGRYMTDADGSVQTDPRITSSPPTLFLSQISKGDAIADETLRDYVVSQDIRKHDNIIDPANYDFQGDGTGSSLPNPLETTVFNPEIDLTGIFSDTEIEKLKSKDGTGNAYKTLLTHFILASDHLPAVSVSTDNQNFARTVRENEQFKLLQAAKTQGVRRDNPGSASEPKRQRSGPPELPGLPGLPGLQGLQGGYRKKHKKRKSQRKLSQRKFKRHTKKRKY